MQEGVEIPVNELTIIFEAPISPDTNQFQKISGIDSVRESLAYEKQCQWISQFAKDKNPVQTGREEVLLFAQYNEAMQSILPLLLDCMSQVAGVKVGYALMTDEWQDVTYDLDLGHRIMTDAELQEAYGPNDEEPTIHM